MITGFIFNSLSYMKTVDITKSRIVKDVYSSKRNVKLSICKKTQVAIQFISMLLTSIALNSHTISFSTKQAFVLGEDTA